MPAWPWHRGAHACGAGQDGCRACSMAALCCHRHGSAQHPAAPRHPWAQGPEGPRVAGPVGDRNGHRGWGTSSKRGGQGTDGASRSSCRAESCARGDTGTRSRDTSQPGEHRDHRVLLAQPSPWGAGAAGARGGQEKQLPRTPGSSWALLWGCTAPQHRPTLNRARGQPPNPQGGAGSLGPHGCRGAGGCSHGCRGAGQGAVEQGVGAVGQLPWAVRSAVRANPPPSPHKPLRVPGGQRVPSSSAAAGMSPHVVTVPLSPPTVPPLLSPLLSPHTPCPQRPLRSAGGRVQEPWALEQEPQPPLPGSRCLFFFRLFSKTLKVWGGSPWGQQGAAAPSPTFFPPPL